MHKSKCPVCGSAQTVKNGKRKGVQTYKCQACGYQFRNSTIPSNDEIWILYMEGKQTISELSHRFGVSESTIKRRLKDISKSWEQPTIEGSGYVHMDATYWGRSWGVLLALDEHSGFPLYLAFIENETASDYEAAIRSIEERGYTISGIIIDGKKGLFALFSDYRIQMCQFHMKQIIRRYLTQNPRLKAARELKDLLDTLTISSGRDFKANYGQWKEKWKDTLAKRSLLKCGKRSYTHKRLRSAMHSLDFYMPYLFTFQQEGCEGRPNTNNKIEGTFTNLKKRLNVHSGMTEMSRKRLISGFFLALAATHGIKKQAPLK